MKCLLASCCSRSTQARLAVLNLTDQKLVVAWGVPRVSS